MSKWNPESIAKLEKKQIESLLQNARRLCSDDIVALCESELERLQKSKLVPKRSVAASAQGDFVAGYHFVCGGHRGVIDNKDGTFWTGSWVVARHNVDESMKFGAYVALHENKNEASYLQGEIVEYRLRERDMIDKENTGIEFRCRLTVKPLMWVGGGSGEKGYLWQSISSLKSE